jgi:predicted transposase YbfD/YdcC
VDKGHGRVEVRTARTTGLLTLRGQWPGLKQGVELRRERRVNGKVVVEVSYAVTSLSPERADAGRLLQFVRDHWRIENQLHWVRDVTLGEDRCRVRAGAAPQVLAALRNAVVHLLATVPADSHKAAIENLQVNPHLAHKLIGIPNRR